MDANDHGTAIAQASADWRLDLVETMRFDPLEGIIALELHLARLKDSAVALGLAADRHAIRNELHAATFRLGMPARVRLRVSPGGMTAIESMPLPPPPIEPVRVALAPLPLAAADPRWRHETGDREACEAARVAAGTWEVLFLLEDRSIGEGSFTTPFVPRDGQLLTPPGGQGVLRAQLLEAGDAVEARLTADDLAGSFFVGNMVYGLVAATLA